MDYEMVERCRKFTIERHKEAVMNAYKVLPYIPLFLFLILIISLINKIKEKQGGV